MKVILTIVTVLLVGCQVSNTSDLEAQIEGYKSAERYLYNIEQLKTCANGFVGRQVAIGQILDGYDLTPESRRVFEPLRDTAIGVMDFSEADQLSALSKANMELRDQCFEASRVTYQRLQELKLISLP